MRESRFSREPDSGTDCFRWIPGQLLVVMTSTQSHVCAFAGVRCAKFRRVRGGRGGGEECCVSRYDPWPLDFLPAPLQIASP